jgi:hypothetical protein
VSRIDSPLATGLCDQFNKFPQSTAVQTPEWVPRRDEGTGKVLDGGRLWEFVELIAQSRREASLRDGPARDSLFFATKIIPSSSNR